MKTLYLDCGMGAAGDMLTAALLELLPDPEGFLTELNALGIPGVHIEKESAIKCGITGTHVRVTINGQEEAAPPENNDEHHDAHNHTHDHHHDHVHVHEHYHDHSLAHENEHDHYHTHEHDSHTHDHSHNTLHNISHILSHLQLPPQVRDNIQAVYGLIAEAESRVHGVPITEIHFHEVGTMDALADITAVCLLMDRLAPEEVVVSPIHVGSGQVRCAHGILPVPAPATAYILQGTPIYGGKVKGELCTPTGAALLKHFATRFGDMPVMKTNAIGYGMGKKDFEAANCVRALLGETKDAQDIVLELSCNVDDMTAEAIGFAMERLFEGGALEVYTVPIGMKKSRPGILLRAMCKESDREKILSLLFCHTTTLGIRETVSRRHVLSRSVNTISTPFGEIRRKDATGYGVTRSKYEYDDLARIAKERDMSLTDLTALLEKNE